MNDFGYNFVTHAVGFIFNGMGDIYGNGNPHLGPLADNGGPTQTRALLYNANPALSSPAIDAGSNLFCAFASRDQRGLPRPPPGQCDIGAFEVQPYAAPVPPHPTAAHAGQPAPAPIATRTRGVAPPMGAPTPLPAPVRH